MSKKDDRPGFMLWFDDLNLWIAVIESREEFAELVIAIGRYAYDGTIPDHLPRTANAFFEQYSKKVDKDKERYDRARQQRIDASNKSREKRANAKRAVAESNRAVTARQPSSTSSSTSSSTASSTTTTTTTTTITEPLNRPDDTTEPIDRIMQFATQHGYMPSDISRSTAEAALKHYSVSDIESIISKGIRGDHLILKELKLIKERTTNHEQ